MPQHHRRRWLVAALVALAVGGLATACGDAPTATQSGGKLHVTQGARHDEFGDPPTLDPIIIIAEPDPPPPEFDDPWGPCGPTACDDPSNDPCSIDPWVCGYDTPPDPFDPSTEPGDVPGNTARRRRTSRRLPSVTTSSSRTAASPPAPPVRTSSPM